MFFTSTLKEITALVWPASVFSIPRVEVKVPHGIDDPLSLLNSGKI
jgi:hypothetical protein